MLQLIKQNRRADDNQEEFISSLDNHQENIDKLTELELISSIKGKAKDSTLSKLRTTKKGNQFLDDIETALVTEDDIILFDTLSTVYVDSGKEIGNKKKTKQFIAQFRAQTGIDRNKLFYLCETFVTDVDNFKFSQRLEYVFFKGANAFETTFDKDQSRLYQYYLKYQDEFDSVFEEIEKEDYGD